MMQVMQMISSILLFVMIATCLNLNKKTTSHTGDDGTKNIEIMAPLIYLNNFWRIIEMLSCSNLFCELCCSISYSYKSINNICNN